MTKTRKVVKYLDKPLFFVTAWLFLFGLIMVFSSSNVTAYMSGKSAYGYFIKQGIFLGVSALIKRRGIVTGNWHGCTVFSTWLAFTFGISHTSEGFFPNGLPLSSPFLLPL